MGHFGSLCFGLFQDRWLNGTLHNRRIGQVGDLGFRRVRSVVR